MLDILLIYLGIGIACVPLSFYAMFTTGKDDRDESPLIFWLAMLTICIATVPLWPIFVALITNHFYLSRKKIYHGKLTEEIDWKTFKESWHSVTSLSDELENTLIEFLGTDELNGEKERNIRLLFTKVEEAYDKWAVLKSNILLGQDWSLDGDRNPDLDKYLDEGSNWPSFKVSIELFYDPKTKRTRISHSTRRTLFPEVETVYYRVSPLAQKIERITENVQNPWQVTLSGAFRSSIKKLRGQEKEKLEHALEDILFAPATAIGNTKTPLSNNLKDFWRYRLGDWRIIYTVDLASKTVTLLDYTHRSKAYH